MIIRFEQFEIDTEAFRLTRDGEDLRLAKQPLDLLIFLIEKNGKLATREDIGTALWGNPGVDEHSINTTVRKIRAALGDDPQEAKYIETLVRRGYRFIAPITFVEPASAAVVKVTDENPPTPPVPDSPNATGRRSPFTRPVAILAAAFFMAVAMLATVWERDRIEGRTAELAWKPLTGTIRFDWKLASDGKSIFWTEASTTGCRPMQVPVDGGSDPVPVRSPYQRGRVLDADPTGHLLLTVPETCRPIDFASIQGPLWELNTSTGLTQRIGNLVGQDAAWSSDGHRVALAQWNSIWLANRDGSGARLLATLPGDVKGIRWSPDGSLLRFGIVPDAKWNYPLWEADTSTGETRQVLPAFYNSVNGGAWLPGGAFLLGGAGPNQSDLWQLDPPLWQIGKYRNRPLTNGPLGFLGPTNIPGHSELAVIGERQQGELERFDSESHRFVPFLKGISAEMADFSRDGNWVVYVTYPNRELWRCRPDGSEALQLTHEPLRAALPRISPDNRMILFTGDYSGQQLRTWLVPFDGGTPRTVTQLAPGSAEVGATWSPDGSQFLVRLDRKGQANVIQMVDLASGKAEIIPGSEHKFNQRWSPDGKWIVATPHGTKGLEVFDRERRQWKTLTSMWADYPNWSHKSDFIYFATNLESGEEAIYRVSIATGRTEKVASLSDDRRANDRVYAEWVGIDADDSPLITKSEDLQQIFLLSIRQ